MAMSSLFDLFHDTLRDMYYDEKKLTKVLPKMAKKASNERLAEAFETHLSQTEGQIERLDKVFELIEKPARGKKCEAMEGLAKEGDHVIKESDDPNVMDAGLIAAAHAVEHYEISRYGALIAWANVLGEDEASELLSETLEEEKATDELLNGIAEEINEAANSKGEEEEEGAEAA